MLNTIEKLREKPEAYRMKVALIVAASIAGIIFMVWISVLGVRFSNSEERISEQKASSLIGDVRGEFSEVFETGKERFEETKREIEDMLQQ